MAKKKLKTSKRAERFEEMVVTVAAERRKRAEAIWLIGQALASIAESLKEFAALSSPAVSSLSMTDSEFGKMVDSLSDKAKRELLGN